MHKTLGHPGLVREALVCINTKYDADSRIQNPRRLNDQEIAVELYSRSFISRVAASRAVLTTTLLQPLVLASWFLYSSCVMFLFSQYRSANS